MNIDPQVQNNLFGHEIIFNNLFQLYKNNNLPNKILLSGDKGIGKSTLSYHLVNSILSEDEEYSYSHKNFQIILNIIFLDCLFMLFFYHLF